jgi:hypothetical protein
MPAVRLCVVLATFILLSCRQNHPQWEAINAGLETSTRVLKENCDTTVSALIHGSRFITDEYWAVRWQPFAARETLIAIQAADFIDSLQKELSATHQVTDERKRILFDTLLHYKHSLPELFRPLQSQPDFKYLGQHLPAVYASLAILPGYPTSPKHGSDFLPWKDSTFSEDEMLTRIALTKLKHDLILSAYQLIQFVKREIAELVLEYTRFDAVETLSAGVVKPGASIQITAGIGRFRPEPNPVITIGNKRATLTDDAVAIRSITAPQRPGNYSIPLRIEFTKPDGSTAWREDTLHYEVVAPCAP